MSCETMVGLAFVAGMLAGGGSATLGFLTPRIRQYLENRYGS